MRLMTALLLCSTICGLSAVERIAIIPASVFAGPGVTYKVDGQDQELRSGGIPLPVDRRVRLSWSERGAKHFDIIALDKQCTDNHAPDWQGTTGTGFRTGSRLEMVYRQAIAEARSSLARSKSPTTVSTTSSTEAGTTTTTVTSTSRTSAVVTDSSIEAMVITVAANGSQQPAIESRSLRHAARGGEPQVRCWIKVGGTVTASESDTAKP